VLLESAAKLELGLDGLQEPLLGAEGAATKMVGDDDYLSNQDSGDSHQQTLGAGISGFLREALKATHEGGAAEEQCHNEGEQSDVVACGRFVFFPALLLWIARSGFVGVKGNGSLFPEEGLVGRQHCGRHFAPRKREGDLKENQFFSTNLNNCIPNNVIHIVFLSFCSARSFLRPLPHIHLYKNWNTNVSSSRESTVAVAKYKKNNENEMEKK